MKAKLALLLVFIALLLCACGYGIVEETPIRVGCAAGFLLR